MPGTIDTLLAESAIRKVQMRYCRAADRVDFDLLRSCFHPVAVVQFSFFEGSVDEFIVLAERMLKDFTITTHFTGNGLIEVGDNSAWCEFYTLATHRIAADEKGPERDYATSVRYLDHMQCRDGEWRIMRRRCVLDWARTDPVPQHCEGDRTGDGTRDRRDPSYQLAEQLFGRDIDDDAGG